GSRICPYAPSIARIPARGTPALQMPGMQVSAGARHPGAAVRGASSAQRAGASNVETKVNNVAFADHVALALEPELPGLAGALLAAARDELLVADDLCPDETALEVAMDDAGRLGSRGVLLARPRANLLDSGRVERLQAQQPIGRANHAVQARLGQVHAREELGALGLGQLRDLGFERG